MVEVRHPAAVVALAALAFSFLGTASHAATSDPSLSFEFHADGAGVRASNAVRGFEVSIDARGALVAPTPASGEAWSVGIGTRGIAREGGSISDEPGSFAAGGSRVGLHRATYEEWFVHGRDGLEHGWTIHRRPTGSGAL
jgi:hypothetical protein